MNIEWPYSLDDPVRAMHFALEGACMNVADCPAETTARLALEAYQKWQATQELKYWDKEYIKEAEGYLDCATSVGGILRDAIHEGAPAQVVARLEELSAEANRRLQAELQSKEN